MFLVVDRDRRRHKNFPISRDGEKNNIRSLGKCLIPQICAYHCVYIGYVYYTEANYSINTHRMPCLFWKTIFPLQDTYY